MAKTYDVLITVTTTHIVKGVSAENAGMAKEVVESTLGLVNCPTDDDKVRVVVAKILPSYFFYDIVAVPIT